jgi:hypothetical protein
MIIQANSVTEHWLLMSFNVHRHIMIFFNRSVVLSRHKSKPKNCDN